MISLRPARLDEAVLLTELCLRSKAVWGYGDGFIRACRSELTLTADSIASSHVAVAEDDGRVVGVAQIEVHGRVAEIAKLFIEPGRLRTGAGRTLFAWARGEASRLGASVLLIDADPDEIGRASC